MWQMPHGYLYYEGGCTMIDPKPILLLLDILLHLVEDDDDD